MTQTAKFAFKLLRCGFRHSAAHLRKLSVRASTVVYVCSKVPVDVEEQHAFFRFVRLLVFMPRKNHTLEDTISTSLDYYGEGFCTYSAVVVEFNHSSWN